MLRAFTAVCEWNAEQPSYETRVAITNAVFRDIAGGNPQKITAWMEAHKDEIINHNERFGMGGKDSQSMVTYFNKKLGKDYERVLSQIKLEKLGIAIED